ncbi:MAG: T9SS type A sorting domain-containing protein [Bacteroidota bacterium]
MKSNIIYQLSTLFLLCLVMAGQGVWAQTSYNLSFANPKLTANPLQLAVDVMISFNEEGKLGSSNLAMEYDPKVLTNPQLISQHLSDVPTYLEPNLSLQMEGRVALNIELLTNGQGDEIGLDGDEFRIARISFDLFSTEDLINLNWYESGTVGTVVFSDDSNFTQLNPAKLESMTFNPSDFPAQDLILRAVQVGLDAELEWEDVADLQALNYEVERSVDGDLFEVIANVDKNANQGAGQTYTYLDEGIVNSLEGTIYYRVKQKEVDGTYITSNTVELTVDEVNALDLQAFPNPVVDEVKIQWVDLGGKAEISLMNAKGQLVKTAKTEIGQSSLEWDLSKISTGLYFIEYKNLDLQNMRASVTVQVK